MKVRLVPNYASSERLVSELYRQWYCEGLLKDIEWVYDHSYDLLFIFNDWGEIPQVSIEQIFVIAQEPEWSPNYRNWNGLCAEFIAPCNNRYPYMFYHHGAAMILF